jgi:Flagellar basal body-associated protein
MAIPNQKTTIAGTNVAKIDTRKSRRLGLVVALVALVGIASAGAGYVLGNSRMSTQAGDTTRSEAPIFVALEPFTVNLKSDDGRNRFLHIGMSLRVADVQSQKQAMQYLPQLRSRILLLLSNRQADSLATQDDRTQLAGEILQALNRPVTPDQPPSRFTDIAFTAFMIQ